MLAIRKVEAPFWLMSALCVLFITTEMVAQVDSAQTDLTLVSVGNGKTKNGHWTTIKFYEAPDGTKGQIVYTEFESLLAAQQQIEDWVKATRTVTSREQNQRKGGRLINDRILAFGYLPKTNQKEFVILRRDELKCYFIESKSLQVAMQVEGLIDHK